MTNVLILCIALFSAVSHSDLSINKLPDAQQLAGFLASINNISANFVQHTHDGNNDLLQTQKGTLFLSRPNKFKWITQAPYEQALDNRLSSTPVLLLSGDSNLVAKEYQVYGETLQDEQHFVLIPKRNDALFDRLRLEFAANRQLTRMVIKDETGQKTVINLSKQKTIDKIDVKTYEFIVPAGTDVIKSQ
jgi:outer membrane lipoprotein carrier protein